MAAGSRRAAAFALARWILTKEFAPSLLPDGPDRSFIQDLVYTSIRRLRPLRLVLGELVRKWPKGELEALLYIGGAQILYMNDVPDFAAVSETVEAAKSAGGASSSVVNGVLRNLIRRREEFENLIASSPLEVRESFPTQLVRRWVSRFGEENAAAL
jgi:16S rRNA (cytosine967-C5)-methyltransferase